MQFGGSEAIITALSDEFPLLKKRRKYFVAILFIFYMFVGIVMCTKGGILIMEWLIVYGTSWGLLIAVLCETIVISFIYGINEFVKILREMLGFEPGQYWRTCWTTAAPIFLLGTIISCFITYQPLQYQDYVYPEAANIFGIFFALSAVLAIPLVGVYMLCTEESDTFTMKLKSVLTPVHQEVGSELVQRRVSNAFGFEKALSRDYVEGE